VSAHEHLISGVVPILVTPFTESGGIDWDSVDSQVDFLIGREVRWAGIGFGSEVNRLSPEEVTQLTARCASRGGDKLRVVGNAELAAVPPGVEAIRRVAGNGGAMAMVRPAGLAGYTQDELFDAFAAVAEAGGLPVIVQDAPSHTGVTLTPQTLARLLVEVPGVAAIKVEAAAPAPKVSAVIAAATGERGAILTGAMGLDWLHECQRGAEGTMPGPAFPEAFAEIARRISAGNSAGAVEIFARILPVTALGSRGLDVFLFAQKHLLVRHGVLASARLRLPRAEPAPQLVAEIDELIDEMTLLELPAECGIGASPRIAV
jgi:4-hydroxy-tetrahydrodipicolinate synthase